MKSNYHSLEDSKYDENAEEDVDEGKGTAEHAADHGHSDESTKIESTLEQISGKLRENQKVVKAKNKPGMLFSAGTEWSSTSYKTIVNLFTILIK